MGGTVNQIPTSDDELRRLLTEAGRRPPVPAADAGALHEAARLAWQEAVEARRGAGRRRAWTAAASVVLLAGAAAWWLRTRPLVETGAVVAQLERFSGDIRVEGVAGLSAGVEVRQGAELRTGGSGSFLALRMAGRSLRLDAETEVVLAAADTLVLRRGAVYVDSRGAGASGVGFEVETKLGKVREIGTQFEVRLANGDEPLLRVRVREGSVALERDAGRDTAAAGEELSLRRSGAATRARIAADAADWRWAIAAAPPFAIEGARLGEFLDWLARETAWRVVYADADLERAARGIVMHGATVGLSPEEAVAVVLASSGLEYRLEGGVLRIDRGKS